MFNRTKVGCGSGIFREDTPTIMDGLVVRYTFGQHSEISASRNGVAIHSVMAHAEGRDRLNTILDWAFQQHEHIQSCYSQGFYAKVDAIPQSNLTPVGEEVKAIKL